MIFLFESRVYDISFKRRFIRFLLERVYDISVKRKFMIFIL